MLVTSKEANNILKMLYDDKAVLIHKEAERMLYHFAVGENLDDIRSEYDFEETKRSIDTIDDQVAKIKHAINVFNSTTTIEGTNITIDQVLIRIAQLTKRKSRYDRMRVTQKKTRCNVVGNIIDYLCVNFDPVKADEEYQSSDEELKYLQTALDLVNNTVQFEIPDVTI